MFCGAQTAKTSKWPTRNKVLRDWMRPYFLGCFGGYLKFAWGLSIDKISSIQMLFTELIPTTFMFKKIDLLFNPFSWVMKKDSFVWWFQGTVAEGLFLVWRNSACLLLHWISQLSFTIMMYCMSENLGFLNPFETIGNKFMYTNCSKSIISIFMPPKQHTHTIFLWCFAGFLVAGHVQQDGPKAVISKTVLRLKGWKEHRDTHLFLTIYLGGWPTSLHNYLTIVTTSTLRSNPSEIHITIALLGLLW